MEVTNSFKQIENILHRCQLYFCLSTFRDPVCNPKIKAFSFHVLRLKHFCLSLLLQELLQVYICDISCSDMIWCVNKERVEHWSCVHMCKQACSETWWKLSLKCLKDVVCSRCRGVPLLFGESVIFKKAVLSYDPKKNTQHQCVLCLIPVVVFHSKHSSLLPESWNIWFLLICGPKLNKLVLKFKSVTTQVCRNCVWWVNFTLDRFSSLLEAEKDVWRPSKSGLHTYQTRFPAF